MPLAGTTTITLSAPDPRLTIVSRPIAVTVGASPPINLDGINGPVTFNCNEGDVATIKAKDVSKGGVESPEATLVYTAADTTTVPASPVISASFSIDLPAPAPTPAPTPAAA